MTDMARCFYNAWSDVMAPPGRRLICIFHVMNKWKEHYPKAVFTGPEGISLRNTFKSHLYKMIRTPNRSQTKHEFEKERDETEFLKEIKIDKFAEYFSFSLSFYVETFL